MLGITQGMADFLGPSGIRVNAVSPSVVASGLMGADRLPYFQAEMDAAAIYPRRISHPDEVAQAVLYLIENSMMNDFEIRVDGGWRGSSNWGGVNDRECGSKEVFDGADLQRGRTPSLSNESFCIRSRNKPLAICRVHLCIVPCGVE